jgi:hypothetical protein
MKTKFAFIFSTRFWALVIGGLSIAAQSGFTKDAWLKGLIFIISGFTVVRTIDKTAETINGVGAVK